MLESTKPALTAVLNMDPSITAEERRAVLAVLEGKSAAPLTNQVPIDRVISRAAAADILGVSKRTVTTYAARGIIKAVANGKNGQRANGYSEASVRAAAAGLANAKAKAA